MAASAVLTEPDRACPVCAAPADAHAASCPGCESPLALETRTVARWRGYVRSTFFLADADELLVAESPPFRHAKEEDARAALEALAERLAELGWTPAGCEPDGEWFELRFERLVAARAEEPDVENRVEHGDEHNDGHDVGPGDEPEPAAEIRPRPAPALLRPVVAAAPPAPAFAAPAVFAPAPAAPAPPPPAPAAPSRRSRVVTIVSVAGLVAASVLVTILVTGRHASAKTVLTVAAPKAAPVARAAAPAAQTSAAQTSAAQTTAAQTTAAQTTAAQTTAAAAAGEAAPAPADPVRLVITATRTSWLEVRRGSSTGPVVFSGNLETGKSVRARGARLWARFGAAGNLEIALDGKPLALAGTLERAFRSR
jgi:hypothetical protein